MALALVAGCYSGVSGFGDGGDAGESTGGNDDAGDESSSGSGGEALECDDAEIRVGHMPLRRLTSEQYANAVRDLFGVEADVGAFGGDEKLGPFDANYAAPVSPTMVEQLRAVAEDVAAEASLDPAGLLSCDPAVVPTCLRDWVSAVGRRAYRRPLTDEELARYETLLALGQDDAARVRLVIQAMLQAPSFLYQLELDLPEPAGEGVVALGRYELASRLALFLWASVPDDALLDAAAAGELDDPEGLRAHAERMLGDPHARATVESFHVQWLHLDRLSALDKDPAVYPLFDDELRAAMLAETRRFTSRVIFEGDAKLTTLLTSSEAYIDAPLFPLYGLPPAPGTIRRRPWPSIPRSGRACSRRRRSWPRMRTTTRRRRSTAGWWCSPSCSASRHRRRRPTSTPPRPIPSPARPLASGSRSTRPSRTAPPATG